MYITNSTFAFLSILNGDAFAKQFGGETGDDPDFFSVVFRSYVNGVQSTDSVEFFLADYRFANNNEDFIVDEWTWLDLSEFGEVDSLSFTMRSSDVGEFGINTPLFFCVDNITVTNTTVSTANNVNTLDLDVYPTLVDENLTVALKTGEMAELRLIASDGKLIFSQSHFGSELHIDMHDVAPGFYYLQVEQADQFGVAKIIKK